MYQNLGNTNMVNVFKGDAPHVNFNVGYTFTTAPIYTNSKTESYNGNSFSYNEDIDTYNTSTLDIEAGVTAYPIYGEKYGFGAYAKVAAGIGLLFQNARSEAAFGFRGYYGTPTLQIFGEVGKGVRTFSHTPWIDSQEFGEGRAKYNYTQARLGLRYNFEMDLKGDSPAHLEVAPIFELPDFLRSDFAVKPTTFYWIRGLGISLDVEHRLKIFMNAYWNYYRTGEVENIYRTGERVVGTFLNFGVLRNLDYFAEGPDYSYKSHHTAKGWAIEALTPSFNWIASHQDTTFNSRFNPSINLVNVEKDFKLTRAFNLFVGAGLALNTGGTTKVVFGNEVNMLGQNFYGGNELKISNTSLTIPFGVRIKLDSYRSTGVPWVKVGLKNYMNLSRKAYLSTNGNEFLELENKSEFLKSFNQAVMIGAGIDVPVGRFLMRLGASYDQSMSNVTTDKTETRFKSVRISYGFVF